MKAYLKWAYWYKNFWDEMLLFGVINRIYTNYDIEELVVEVWEIWRMKQWIRLNKKFDFVKNNLGEVKFLSIRQHKFRVLTHIINFLWFGKYKHYFKFFGGGQVLDDSRGFPHDGRNLLLLYNYTIRKWNFALLGGIWSINKPKTKLLYNYILNKAKRIVVREENSYHIVEQILSEKSGSNSLNKLSLYNDFSFDVINLFTKLREKSNPKEKYDWKKSCKWKKYVLINLSVHALSKQSYEKIEKYCEDNSKYKKIYFYCDYYDDKKYYNFFEKTVSNLRYYDWTKYDLFKTLELFYQSEWWIWARLHFLYPLKIFNKQYISLVHSDKIENLIEK